MPPPEGRWTQGPSLDGKGEFRAELARPHGQEPKLAPPRPDSGAQSEQMSVAGQVGELATHIAGAAKQAVHTITGGKSGM